MVEILEFLNEFTLEILYKTSEEPEVVKAWIITIKDPDAPDAEVKTAQVKLKQLAEDKGIPCVIGDLLTYGRAFIGKQLRSESITSIERFEFLQRN